MYGRILGAIRSIVREHSLVLGVLGVCITLIAGAYNIGMTIGDNRETFLQDKLESADDEIARQGASLQEVQTLLDTERATRQQQIDAVVASQSEVCDNRMEQAQVRSDQSIANLNQQHEKIKADLNTSIWSLQTEIEQCGSTLKVQENKASIGEQQALTERIVLVGDLINLAFALKTAEKPIDITYVTTLLRFGEKYDIYDNRHGDKLDLKISMKDGQYTARSGGVEYPVSLGEPFEAVQDHKACYLRPTRHDEGSVRVEGFCQPRW